MIFMAHGIDDATLTVSTGTAHTNYPVTNLNSRVFGKLLKTTGASLHVDIDFGSVRTCDSIVLGNTNYDDSWTLKVGDGVDDGVTFDATEAIGSGPSPSATGFYSIYASAGGASRRYWRLEFDNWDTSYYIGQVFLGADYETPYNHDYNFSKGYQYGVQSNLTRGGIDLRYKYHEKKYIEQSLRFRGFTDAQVTAFLDYFNDSEKCDGTLKPFFFIPDGESAYCHYAYFDNETLTFNKVVEDFNEITLNIRQVL